MDRKGLRPFRPVSRRRYVRIYIMKLGKYLLLLFISLTLSGCASRIHIITSDYTPIKGYPYDIPPIYLPLALRSTPYVEGFRHHFKINDSFNSKFYFANIKLDCDLKASRPGITNDFIEVFSLFLPPLSLVKTPVNINYSISYSINDLSDETIIANTIYANSTGYFQGWYFMRILAKYDLFKEQIKQIRLDSVNLIVNDINKNIKLFSANTIDNKRLEYRPYPKK